MAVATTLLLASPSSAQTEQEAYLLYQMAQAEQTTMETMTLPVPPLAWFPSAEALQQSIKQAYLANGSVMVIVLGTTIFSHSCMDTLIAGIGEDTRIGLGGSFWCEDQISRWLLQRRQRKGQAS